MKWDKAKIDELMNNINREAELAVNNPDVDPESVVMKLLNVGDRVNWYRRGRHGFIESVAGVVLKKARKRVLIRVAKRAKFGGWRREERWVRAIELTIRVKHVPEVDDEVDG